MALNFLFASWGNPGNLNPFLTAARRLRDRGHRVRFLGDARQQAETMEAGFPALAWRRPAPIVPPAADSADPAWDEIRALLGQITFGGAVDYAADTMDALLTEPVDAIVVHSFLTGPAIAAEALCIPRALLAPHVSIRPLDGVPFGIEDLTPSDAPQATADQQAAQTRFASLMNSYLPTLNRARVAFGVPPFNDVFDHYDRADRMLIGLSSAFDFAAKSLPANLRYVGPLLDLPSWAQAWTPPWTGRPDRPRVLVSLSTSFQNQAALLGRIIAALGRMDLDAVVTIGPAMAERGQTFEAPANVSIVHSAPHDAVMKEVSLVITHGGHGTVVRSLIHGVPLLVIPMGRDQADNAARVVARGAGLHLAASATEETLAAAVHRLVTEPHFKTAASRLGQAIEPDVRSPVFAAEMEAIATRRLYRTA